MEQNLGEVSAWFLKKQRALEIFAEHDCRVEGWFKGELLLCLDGLRHRGQVQDFEREYSPGKAGWGIKDEPRIDLRIRLDGQDHLCELKALCISVNRTTRDLSFYFRPRTQVGLWKDFRKLERMQPTTPAWILSFIYPSPGKTRWEMALQKWASEIGPWTCSTSPHNYPDGLFVALWRRTTSSVP